MAEVADNVLDVVGDTPLIRLRRVVPEGHARVLGKMEGLNPAGSVKDRIALAMVEAAEREKRLGPGDIIVGVTSGNTGVSLAMVAAVRGYRLVIFMPENAPAERRRLLARYGAEVHLTPAYQGMGSANEAARVFAGANPGCAVLDMFNDPAVVRVHRETTAAEILRDAKGRVDAFVAGVGTGGTLTGVGQRLKEENPSLKIVAVEPASSPVLSRGAPGFHTIPGIGADFHPPLMARDVPDEIVAVTGEDANAMSLRLAREEGILAGISSGANVVASIRTASELGDGSTVVTVLADTGERYVNFPM
jgi:cysteine synthase A